MKKETEDMIDFSCDYNCGAAPQIIAALADINNEQNATYGFDKYSHSAKEKICAAVGNPAAEVWFLTGGTQTNATVLSVILHSCEGVLSADTGHIALHEAGAVEACGHKVLTVACAEQGKMDIAALRDWLVAFHADPTAAHMVQPGAVYISQPTEYGGLYSKAELLEIRRVCDAYGLRLYVDGARLAYALASPQNDVTLKDLGACCDAFYIGGTKCGTLFGEAAVFRAAQPHFFTHRKQHGALLAKGWLLGLQFDLMFTDGLYERLGKNGVTCALELKRQLAAKGVEFYGDSATNQQFVLLSGEQLACLESSIGLDVWERCADGRSLVRLCTSWRTTPADVNTLVQLL